MNTVRFKKEGNPFYPLPPDFPSLSLEGKRAARLNAMFTQTTPEDYALAWTIFRGHYLRHESAHFYKDWVEPSQYHTEWAYFRKKYQYNVIGAHRGSAKSTIIGTEFPLFEVLTNPYKTVFLILPDDRKVERRFDVIQQQLESNKAILEDFGPMRPSPSSGGMWTKHAMRLLNGAELLGYSVSSKRIRGERPYFMVIDDPEYDSSATTSNDKVIEGFENLLFTVLLPTMRRSSSMFWIGTPIDPKSFLWRLSKGEDERLKGLKWNRKIYSAVNDNNEIFWEGEYSKESLEEKRREVGEAAWSSEYMCNPTRTANSIFTIGPNSTYDLKTGPDFKDDPDPLQSNSVITFEGKECRVGPWVTKMSRAIAVDWIYRAGPYSDRAVVHVLGRDSDMVSWSLDLFSERIDTDKLIPIIWKYATKWKVRLVGCEGNAVQWSFYKSLAEYGQKHFDQFGWSPQVVPIKVPHGVSKEIKISALSYPFGRGKIKLPLWREVSNPAYRRLMQQIRTFDGTDKSLEHDDEIDTLALYHTLVPPGKVLSSPGKEHRTVCEMMKSGETHTKDGLPLALALPLAGLSVGELADIEKVRGSDPEGQEKTEWILGDM